MSYRTTKQERRVRIDSLVWEAGEGAVQALLEVAVEAMKREDFELPRAAAELANAVAGTFSEQEPDFAVGAQVSKIMDNGDRPRLGKVQDRYLDEDGEWAYTIWSPYFGTSPYREVELAPAA